MKYLVALVLVGSIGTAAAQAPLPADCVATPSGPTSVLGGMQVAVPLKSQRGGYAMFTLPETGATTCQAAQPTLPEDVLHGTPDPELLRGFGPRDVLHNVDPPPPREADGSVYIDVR